MFWVIILVRDGRQFYLALPTKSALTILMRFVQLIIISSQYTSWNEKITAAYSYSFTKLFVIYTEIIFHVNSLTPLLIRKPE